MIGLLILMLAGCHLFFSLFTRYSNEHIQTKCVHTPMGKSHYAKLNMYLLAPHRIHSSLFFIAFSGA